MPPKEENNYHLYYDGNKRKREASEDRSPLGVSSDSFGKLQSEEASQRPELAQSVAEGSHEGASLVDSVPNHVQTRPVVAVAEGKSRHSMSKFYQGRIVDELVAAMLVALAKAPRFNPREIAGHELCRCHMTFGDIQRNGRCLDSNHVAKQWTRSRLRKLL